LKKFDARARRPLSTKGSVEEQVARMSGKLPQGTQLLVLDDRIQTGGALKTIVHIAKKHGVSPFAVLVGHSELSKDAADSLIPGVCVSARLYDFASAEEARSWRIRHARGEVRMPRADELHDIVSISPASGEAIVDRYLEAYPLLRPVYNFLKGHFIKFATICQDGGDISSTGVPVAFEFERLRGLGVEIFDESRLCDYLSKRVNEFALAKREAGWVSSTNSEDSERARKVERGLRWGAHDVDYLFSRSIGCLRLTGCPKFNTDEADRKVRYGHFWPYPHRDSIALQSELRATSGLAWAHYSLDELRRTAHLVEQWESEFGSIDPIHIPALAAPAIRNLMARKRKDGALEQVHYLIEILQDQIRADDVKPLV